MSYRQSLWFAGLMLGLLVPAVKCAAAESAIGYDTVAEAKQALLATPGVTSKQQNGWLIVEEPGNGAIWSFVPEGHEAYPAVGKRMLIQDAQGLFSVKTLLLCQAAKEPCDRLAESYRELDRQMQKAAEEALKKQQ